ncbi:13856_t:CDS:2, partial [Cetraspora pellucida]
YNIQGYIVSPTSCKRSQNLFLQTLPKESMVVETIVSITVDLTDVAIARPDFCDSLMLSHFFRIMEICVLYKKNLIMD